MRATAYGKNSADPSQTGFEASSASSRLRTFTLLTPKVLLASNSWTGTATRIPSTPPCSDEWASIDPKRRSPPKSSKRMVRAISTVSGGPLTGAPVAFAISTGDATDNCQSNELATYINLLNGSELVTTDSGKRGQYDGVGALEHFDPWYWHPNGSPDGEPIDVPRSEHGFPLVPEQLLEAAMTPFISLGLPLSWYAVYGKHDALFGGTLVPGGQLAKIAIGSEKRIGLGEEHDPLALLLNNEVAPSPGLWGLVSAPVRQVPADPDRAPVTPAEWVARHLQDSGAPFGHGLANAKPGCRYDGFDVGVIRFLVLDTVNQAGGWQGSLDDEQLHWLEEELATGSRHFSDTAGLSCVSEAEDRLFVLVLAA